MFIGVIYDGTMGTPTQLFGLRGTVPPTFQDEKVKNLLSHAVNRGHLRILNYNKTVFGRTPERERERERERELMTLSQTPSQMGGGTFFHCLPLSSWDPRAPHSPSELVPPLFRPKLHPCICFIN